MTETMTEVAPPNLSEARAQRYQRRARAALATDPFLALANIHKLLDGGFRSSEILQLQANVLLQLGCGTSAARAAEAALDAGGDRSEILLLLLKCYLSAYHRKPAARLIPRILELEPLSAEAKSEVAHAAQEIHQYDLAERLYQELLDDDPSNSKLLVNLGYAFQKQGLMDQATASYLTAISINPSSANAYKLLSSVRKQTKSDNHLAVMQDAVPLFEKDSDEFVTAMFALGKTFEDLEKYQQAFQYFSAGADAMRPKSPYDSKTTKQAFDLTKGYFEHPQKYSIAEPSSAASHQSVPLFILGMPRTGSTLIDRILSSHTDVQSMGELGCFKESMKVLTGFAGGAGFHEHFYQQPERHIDLHALGELYVSAAAPEDRSGRYFIDKYPMNFMDLGLIAKALPDALFVHTLRDPMDTCFSNFKQLFTLGFYHYSYSMRECAEYYLSYLDLMRIWKAQLPGRIIDVQYEDMVCDTEAQVRRLLGFLQLDWQDQCLTFHKNQGPVDTASLSQVRQPIYRSAVRHWKHYRSFVQDAIDVFQAAGIDVDAEQAASDQTAIGGCS